MMINISTSAFHFKLLLCRMQVVYEMLVSGEKITRQEGDAVVTCTDNGFISLRRKTNKKKKIHFYFVPLSVVNFIKPDIPGNISIMSQRKSHLNPILNITNVMQVRLAPDTHRMRVCCRG